MTVKNLIYFVRQVGGEGPIKIGCSRSPGDRLMVLSTWSPYELEMIACCAGSIQLEKKIHDRFVHLHMRHEWFEPSAELLEGIEKVRQGLPLAECFDLENPRGNIRGQAIQKRNDGYKLRKTRPELFSSMHRLCEKAA